MRSTGRAGNAGSRKADVCMESGTDARCHFLCGLFADRAKLHQRFLPNPKHFLLDPVAVSHHAANKITRAARNAC